MAHYTALAMRASDMRCKEARAHARRVASFNFYITSNMMPYARTLRIVVCIVACSAAQLTALLPIASHAQTTSPKPSATNPLERRCWASYTNQRTKPASANDGVRSVGFSNLRDGYRVYSPFKVEFAVRGMGVAPAGKQLDGTGHHHILIDRRLPSDVSAELPFDDKHKHFGKGQTSTLLDLPPGKHTLRLLFADYQHRPYYVFSDQISVEVIAPRSSLLQSGVPAIDSARFDATCAAWYQNAVTEPRPADAVAHFQNLRDGDVVLAPLNLRLGTEGYGVCSTEIEAEKSGHFVIDVRQSNQLLRKIVLKDGRTQIDLDLRAGEYELRAALLDRGGRSLGAPQSLVVRVDPLRRSE